MSKTHNELLTILLDRIEQNKLILPTLPGIALAVSDAAHNPDVSLASIADVIAKDVGMSARMIHVSNSALYAPRTRIETLTTAVTRIGLSRIKNIACSIAMEQLFFCQSDVVFDYFDRAWNNNVEVSSAAVAALTVYKERQPRHGLRPDTLALMGLMHNIGVLPILTLADQYGDRFSEPADLDEAVAKLSKQIGVAIVEAWGFDSQYAVIIENWDNLDYRTESVDHLDFVRIGAVYAGLIEGDKEALLAPAVEKGILESIGELDGRPFVEAYEEQKATYSV
jgi:HD-like signal output (HDOD) protein